MPEEELNIEELVKITKLPIMKINILLMSLLMKKVIKEYPGKIYKKGLS
jgi:DNA processing protein